MPCEPDPLGGLHHLQESAGHRQGALPGDETSINQVLISFSKSGSSNAIPLPRLLCEMYRIGFHKTKINRIYVIVFDQNTDLRIYRDLVLQNCKQVLMLFIVR
jgi:hypothetical protein